MKVQRWGCVQREQMYILINYPWLQMEKEHPSPSGENEAKKCYLENQLQMSVNIIKIYIGTGLQEVKREKYTKMTFLER